MPLPSPDDPDHLHILVFGPGEGEAIAVHAPPSTWLLVDSVRLGGVNPVADLLAARGAAWSALVLTHAHRDHAAGFLDYLELDGTGPVGCLLPPAVDADPRSNDRALVRTMLAQKVQRRVDAHWDDDPASRWNFHADLNERVVGPLVVAPLWPLELPRPLPHDVNALSTPLLIRWRDATLLLGADLLGAQWGRLSGTPVAAGFSAADPLKVAHHTSLASQHPSVLAGARGRTAVATPFTRHGLPRFEAAEGVATILGHVDELQLTSLRCASVERRLARADLDALERGAVAPRHGHHPRVALAAPDPAEAWVHVEVAGDGTVVACHGGADARAIVP